MPKRFYALDFVPRNDIRHTYIFRNGPVPYTGKLNNSRWFRSIGTFPERRDYYACEDKNLIRASRNPVNIPSSWDDITASNVRSFTWKNKKKRKQWM